MLSLRSSGGHAPQHRQDRPETHDLQSAREPVLLPHAGLAVVAVGGAAGLGAPAALGGRPLGPGPGPLGALRGLGGAGDEGVQELQEAGGRGGALAAQGALHALGLGLLHELEGLGLEHGQHEGDELAEGHALQRLAVPLVQADRPLGVGHVAEAAVSAIRALAHGEVDARAGAEVRMADASGVLRLLRLVCISARIPENLGTEQLVGHDFVGEAVRHVAALLRREHGLVESLLCTR
mmetsp:Transcript_99828/g.291261  ORF Transcript_99828/g.291261 Transcript_99828/m.291261 type:complete len:237 (-) Transcript_99828:1834-2544(-)